MTSQRAGSSIPGKQVTSVRFQTTCDPMEHLVIVHCRRPSGSAETGRELADRGLTSVAFVRNATTENERAQVAA